MKPKKITDIKDKFRFHFRFLFGVTGSKGLLTLYDLRLRFVFAYNRSWWFCVSIDHSVNTSIESCITHLLW